MKKVVLFAVLLILNLSSLIAQPVADFTFNIVGACTSQTVEFMDASTGDLSTWGWDFGDGSTSEIANPTHTYTMGGIYEVCLEVTDLNGELSGICQDIIVADPMELLGAEITNPFCNGPFSGAIDITVAGGILPYTYAWSSGPTTEDIDTLLVGNYTVTVTDANACTLVSTFTLVESPTINIVPQITGFLCNGETGCIDLSNISGGSCNEYFYTWSNGGTDAVQCGLFTGLYEVTITDCNGCSEAVAIQLTEPSPLEIALISTCATAGQDDGSIVSSVTGGIPPYEYVWSNALTSPDAVNIIAGNYGLTVTDANGCFAEAEIETNALINNINSSDNCDGAIQLSANTTDIVSYVWEPSGLLDDPTSATPIATITSPTTVTLTVTNAAGCEDVETIDLSVPNVILLDFNVTDPICGANTGVIEVVHLCNTNPPYAYDWGPGLGNTSTLTGLSEGSYSVTVTDNLGETVTGVVQLINAGYEVVINTLIPAYCTGDEFSLCAEITNELPGATYTYDWSGIISYTEDTTSVCLTDSIRFDYEEGVRTVTVTDDQGCTGSAEVFISVVDVSEMITSINPPFFESIICEGASLQFTANTAEPAANYLFEWSPAATLDDPTIANPIASPSVTTTYTLTVTHIASGCSATETKLLVVDDECVWPGDTDYNNVVNNFDLLNIGIAFDSSAIVRFNASLGWFEQAARQAGLSSGLTVDKKHSDTDGNGIINALDTLAISQNWGLEHNFTGDPDQDSQFFIPDFPQSGLTATVPFYVEPDTFIENETYALSVILGEMGNPAENVYGLAFSIEYDPEVVVPGSVSMSYDGWIGAINEDMLAIQKAFPTPGRIDVGITRIDGLEMSGFGQIGALYITIEDDILFRGEANENRNGSTSVDAVFNITNAVVINRQGEENPIAPVETVGTVDRPTSTRGINWDKYLQIAPNPADDHFLVTSRQLEIQNMKLYSLQGELIQTELPTSSTVEMNTGHLINGTYLLKIQTDLGVAVERIVITR